MKHSPPGWTHPVQPIPVRPSAQTVQVLQANEEQKSCKLPSFNSVSNILVAIQKPKDVYLLVSDRAVTDPSAQLVEQLERNPEPKSASTALSVATEVAWKRQEPGASFVPLEPPTFQFANHNSTGRSGASVLSLTVSQVQNQRRRTHCPGIRLVQDFELRVQDIVATVAEHPIIGPERFRIFRRYRDVTHMFRLIQLRIIELRRSLLFLSRLLQNHH